MKLPAYVFACIALGATSVLAQTPKESPAPTPPPASPVIEKLSPAQVDEALSLLKTNFLNPGKLDEPELKRAALEGVLARLNHGAELLPDQPNAEATPPVPALAEMLDGNLLYFRLGSLDPSNLAALDEAIEKAGPTLAALVLDLRSTPPSTNYEAATEVVKRFVEKGKPLFQLKSPKTNQTQLFTSNTEPLFTGLIMLVTNPNTSQAAETIAGSLREVAPQAMIVGSKTAGEAVEFADFGLVGGSKLRIAVAQVELPSGKSLFPEGIGPDIAISMDPEAERTIAERSQKEGMKKFIADPVRAHRNEAALVSGIDPEIEEYIKRSKNAAADITVPRDIVLQRAIDVVTAVSVLGKEKK